MTDSSRYLEEIAIQKLLQGLEKNEVTVRLTLDHQGDVLTLSLDFYPMGQSALQSIQIDSDYEDDPERFQAEVDARTPGDGSDQCGCLECEEERARTRPEDLGHEDCETCNLARSMR